MQFIYKTKNGSFVVMWTETVSCHVTEGKESRNILNDET